MKKLSTIVSGSLLSLTMVAPVWSGSAVDAASEAHAEGAVTATTHSASVDASGSVNASGSASSDAKGALLGRAESEIKHKTDLEKQLKSRAKTEADAQVDTAAQSKARAEAQAKATLAAQVDATVRAKTETQTQAKADISELMAKAKYNKAHIQATITTYERLIKQGLSNHEAQVLIESYINAGADVNAATEIIANFDGYAESTGDFTLSHDEIAASFSALSDIDAYSSVDVGSVHGELSLPDISDLVNAEMNTEASGSYGGSSASGSFDFDASAGVEIMH